MTSSLLKSALLGSAIFLCAQAVAVPVSKTCKCNHEVSVTSCKKPEAANPSWWRWLTESSSSEFHFFDLIELLHDSDDDKVASHKNINEEQVDS